MDERKNAITMKGSPLTLVGRELKVGDKIPDATLTNSELKEVPLSSFLGEPLLLLAVPSLDTSVCSKEVCSFHSRMGELAKKCKTIVVSTDLPFAQKRWAEKEKIDQITFLSDYRSHDFGQKFGILIKELQLLARCCFVLDKEGRIQQIFLVKEVTEEPPYEKILGSIL